MEEVQRDLEKQRQQIEKVNKALNSPEFRRYAEQRVRLSMRQEAMQKREQLFYDQLRRRMDPLTDKFKRFFDATEKGWKDFLAAGIAGYSVLGLVQGGLADTAEGYQLSYRFQLLRREIAQLFLPAIRALVEWLGKLVLWFRNLTRGQQEAIGRIFLLAGAFLGVVVAVKALGVAFSVLAAHPVLLFLIAVAEELRKINELMNGAKDIRNMPGIGFGMFGATMSAASAQGMASASQSAAKHGTKGEGRHELSAMRVQYEQVQDNFKRVQLAAAKADIGESSPEEQQVGLLKAILEVLRKGGGQQPGAAAGQWWQNMVPVGAAGFFKNR